MGINLATVNYYASQQPFINSFVTSEKWVTHSNATWDTNEEEYVNLDANGWPITRNSVNGPTGQQFNSLGVLFILGMPNTANGIYPAGQYVVLYDGNGKLSYGLDAALVRRSPGRDVINVTSSNKGIDLRIVETDPHSYLRNIKVVTAANEAAAKAGQIFNPAFLKLIQNFRALRFMNSYQANGSTLSSWADRPIPTYAFFGSSKGVPIEIAVRLANTMSRGRAHWPTQSSSCGDYEYGREWFGMRTAQMRDTWRSVWRSDPRLVCMLGAQAAWSFSATEALKCPYLDSARSMFRSYDRRGGRGALHGRGHTFDLP